MNHRRPAITERLEKRQLFALAFPGAEGFGANSTGGRGGEVYHVTNLLDAPTNAPVGSLRYGIDTAPAGGRTIVFDVSGTIKLTDELSIKKSKITIAGQTAPGNGILLRDYALQITSTSNNTIIRHIHSRLGSNPDADNGDAIGVLGSAQNVILDHVSTSWSQDETLSLTNDSSFVTVQDSYITESLNNEGHGYGSLLRPRSAAKYSVIRNLYTQHRNRLPRVGSYNGVLLEVEFTNNVIYNWGNDSGPGYSENNSPGEFVHMNYIGNTYIAGSSTPAAYTGRIFDSASTNTSIYQSDNRLDANKNGLLDGVNGGWSMIIGPVTQIATPYAFGNVTYLDPTVAYNQILDTAGAFPWQRDSVDVRLTNEVRTQTGGIRNTAITEADYPSMPVETRPAGYDTDKDGMPDVYELTRGMNPAVANNNAVAANGYTALEEFINGFAVRMDRTAPTLSAGMLSLDGLPQTITLGFSEAVSRSLSTANLVVTNTTTGTIVPASQYTLGFSGSVATLTFANALADGNYTVTVPSVAVIDAAGNPLAADVSASVSFFRGDMNHDGAVNNADIAPFVSGLTDAAGFAAQYGYGPSLLGDVNLDGTFNNADIAAFVAKLTGSRPAAIQASPAPVKAAATSSAKTRVADQVFGDDRIV